MSIYTIPGKLNVEYNNEVKAIIDTWTTYQVSLDEFREAVLVKGMDYAKAHGAIAWIVDSSKAVGSFNRECQNFIGTDIFPAFAANGIKYFITINSASALTNLTVKEYRAKAGPNGLNLVEMPSAAAAIDWLKSNAK